MISTGDGGAGGEAEGRLLPEDDGGALRSRREAVAGGRRCVESNVPNQDRVVVEHDPRWECVSH